MHKPRWRLLYIPAGAAIFRRFYGEEEFHERPGVCPFRVPAPEIDCSQKIHNLPPDSDISVTFGFYHSSNT